MYVANSFSLSMLPSDREWATVSICRLDGEGLRQTVAEALFGAGLQSCIGHADTARLVGEMLGVSLPACRRSITISPEEAILVAQYTGPRLAEGATALPEGAKIEWFSVRLLFSDRERQERDATIADSLAKREERDRAAKFAPHTKYDADMPGDGRIG